MNDHRDLVNLGSIAFWVFALIVLSGSVVEQMRNIALSTTVTLLVAEGERDKANGLVGMVQGIAFFVTSVFSGLSIGFLGMGPTLWIAIGLTAVALLHLLPIRIPEEEIITAAEAHAAIAADQTSAVETPAEETPPAAATAPAGPPPPMPPPRESKIDLHGSIAVILSVPGLSALILFACFNNLIGGTYMALMDPYGLEIFSPQVWGIVLGLTSTGFTVGGGLIVKTGLGTNPIRTLLLVNVGVAMLGMTFTLREWWWLYIAGIFVFMLLMPAAEACEQTILQRVVPFKRQGRVFGLAQSIETAASPVSAFFVGIIAQQSVIPWVDSPAGRAALGWLLGEGTARGMALMFIVSGFIMLVVVLLAFLTSQYRRLSAYYATHHQDLTTPGDGTSSEEPLLQ